MIIFEEIRYKNFISAGNVWTTIHLNKHKNTLVIGKNGSGKSTILDALCFALFGKPFRNINKPQLVNSINKKNCLVEIKFTIGATKFKIRRGIRPAVFELYQNGKLQNQNSDTKDYQEILEKQVLKLNYKSFKQIAILGAASFVPFMALTTGQRREIIEDLLDLQIFTTMNVLLKDRTSANNKLMQDIISNQELTKEKIDLYNKHNIQMKEAADAYVKVKQQTIVEIEADDDRLYANLETLKFEKQRLEDKLSTMADVTTELKKLNRLEIKIVTELGVVKNELDFFKHNEQCPTCRQDIGSTFKGTAIKAKEALISKTQKGLKKLEQEQTKLRTKEEERDKVSAELANVQHSIGETVAAGLANGFRIMELKKDIDHAGVTNNYTGERIEELTATLEQLEKDYLAALEDKQVFAACATLLKDAGIKAKIIKQYVPVMNKLINKYLSAMDFFVQFELNESFEETIKSRYRDEFSYESFSEGEKKRINLAIIFTWRAIAKLRNSVNTNLFILDEVFDSSLDLKGIEEVLKLLLSLSADNTIIISHDQAFNDKFEHTIAFEKKANFSKISNAV